MNCRSIPFASRALLALCLVAAPVLADHVPPLDQGETTPLDRQVETLKREVLELNRDLSLLEQELLFPSNTQFAVFVTLQENAEVTVDSAQLRVDGQLADSHIYADHESAALRKGGAHRLHLGNLAAGKHLVNISVNGRYQGRREFRRQAQIEVNKALKPVHLELRLEQASRSAEPVLVVKQW